MSAKLVEPPQRPGRTGHRVVEQLHERDAGHRRQLLQVAHFVRLHEHRRVRPVEVVLEQRRDEGVVERQPE
jgi:hypothetical protein